ncbi:MAG TPA: antibiotic biosynthesis monooxygenase [Mycobacteriales bacterium]|nr:antibiotic biosynthesis monooxygenase [Mycobacteriales bacterium]
MIVLSRFEVPEARLAAFRPDAQAALDALARQAGFVRGRLGCSLDEPALWSLVTEWDSVGSYRRGLSAYDVKLATAPLMALSVPEPSAYEVVAAADDAQAPATAPSSRAR